METQLSKEKTTVLKGCLILMRPPNLPTAAADIIAGAAIVGFFTNNYLQSEEASISGFLFLVCSSVFLYAGGVVLNDVFDFKIDAVERPKRPIPSGIVSLKTASYLGFVLLFMGIILSFLSNYTSGFVALLLAGVILLYDKLAKHHAFFGPLAMGTCRGLNLLLGMSILGLPQISNGIYIIIPMIYIFAVTLISRGEVHGNNKNNIVLSGILYAFVILFILFYNTKTTDVILALIPFLILFALAIFTPLIKAYKINSPENIKKAVKAGVLSLVIMDAALAVSKSTWWVGLVVLLLLPLSLFLSKRFQVT